SVGIIGFGGLGISALQLARRLGASRVAVSEVVPSKLDLARSLGAESVLRDIDVALDFVGHAPATLAALRALKPGGRLVLVPINLPDRPVDAYKDVLAKRTPHHRLLRPHARRAGRADVPRPRPLRGHYAPRAA